MILVRNRRHGVLIDEIQRLFDHLRPLIIFALFSLSEGDYNPFVLVTPLRSLQMKATDGLTSSCGVPEGESKGRLLLLQII